MDKKKFTIRFMGGMAIALLLIAVIVELCTFKVIEANLFEEVTKHIVVWLSLLVGVELFSLFIFAPLTWHILYDKKK